MRVVKQSLYNSTAKDQSDYVLAADNDLVNIFMALKGRLSFGNGTASENISGQFVTFTTSATPNAEFSVPHTLGATPIGWLVINKDKAGDLYAGTTAWTSTSVYLKCSVASVTYTIFLI